MQIVLIHWKIRPDGMADFYRFWREQAIVEDRAGLVGEFLSAVEDQAGLVGKFLSATAGTSKFDWINWDDLADKPGCYRSFINVGIWQDAAVFQDQVAKYFPTDKTDKKDFEYEPRVRALLTPEHWRIGGRRLPTCDSDGVR